MYILIYFFEVLINKRNECIFEIKIYSLFIQIIFIMMDNLIYDKKQIWINLKLYFERNDFFEFLGIFLEFF